MVSISPNGNSYQLPPLIHRGLNSQHRNHKYSVPKTTLATARHSGPTNSLVSWNPSHNSNKCVNNANKSTQILILPVQAMLTYTLYVYVTYIYNVAWKSKDNFRYPFFCAKYKNRYTVPHMGISCVIICQVGLEKPLRSYQWNAQTVPISHSLCPKVIAVFTRHWKANRLHAIW